MYHYSICTIADEVIFQKQCRALETHLPHLVKDELLEDVDGSLMQRYWLDGKNDYSAQQQLYRCNLCGLGSGTGIVFQGQEQGENATCRMTFAPHYKK